MNSETIYRIGKFEFQVISHRLRRPDHPNWSKKLGNYETKLLKELILNHERSTEKDNTALTVAVWGHCNDKANPEKPFANLHTSAHKLRAAFRFFEPGETYLLSGPYCLAKMPELISGPSLSTPAQSQESSPEKKLASDVGNQIELVGWHQQRSESDEESEEPDGYKHLIPTVAGTMDRNLDRCDCCGQGLGVIADLRSDRCLVSSGLRNQAWTYDERLNAVLPPQDPQGILSRYFFPSFEHGRDSNQRVAIMSGFDYPQDRDFSESGSLLAYHYINTFGRSRIERVESLENIKQDDALVFLASHQGHPKSREYVGNPRAHSPNHQVKIKAARRTLGYEAELPWAIFTPEDAREIHILQRNNNKLFSHKTKEHKIHSLNGRELRSKAGKDGAHDVWLTDYLLVTALPTDGTEQRRVISFIGLHLTGTLAAVKLLREAPREILDPIHRTLAGQQYFQALISLQVDNTLSSRGLARPGRLTEVQVDGITIRKTRGAHSRSD